MFSARTTFVLGYLTALASVLAPAQQIRGFDQTGSAEQAKSEELLKTVPQASNIRQYLRAMAEEPHHTGSEEGVRVAAYVFDKFKEWGLDASYHEFTGLMPTPKHRSLELLEPETYAAKLAEPALAEDKDSSDDGQLPTYNAYSPDGDVTAQIVYVNYGMPDDYKKLDELGIDVKGKIVLARYMGGWRGIKPKVAAEHGAIGCIIFSDPKDDGFFKGDVYPEGAFRPQWGVQRGSTMDMPTYPGDPLTPGWGSEPGGRQLAVSEAKTLPKIPVLPISWGDALPILRNLAGPVAPEAWRGALPLTYHIGPGASKVRLRVAFNWTVPTGRNVLGAIRGSEFPDEWVIYGNHHDAWVNGATDPVSGNAALMETARTLAEAVRQGWKPKRTILFASWDAEEWGLIGSTEWVEKNADELREKAVVYFNTDSNTSPTLNLGGSHTLERFLNDVARSIPDPRNGSSIWEAMKAKKLEAASDEDKKEIDSRRDLRIAALGSGSDYTAFIDHLAIASTNSGFSGDGGGVYHSSYDSIAWYERFGDPDYLYGKTLAQFHAVALARMADADVLPFEFTNFADTIAKYVEELEKLAEDKDVDLAPARAAAGNLTAVAADYEAAYDKAAADGFKGDAAPLNEILRKIEQSMARPEGLPERDWFKHHIYAPGFYTGYGVKTVPGVREGIEQDDLDRARAQVGKFVEVLAAVAERIQAATREVAKL